MAELSIYLPGILLAYSAFLLSITSPGPNVLAILGTSMSAGRRPGLGLAAGVAAGSFCWALLTVTGLSALLAGQYFSERRMLLSARLTRRKGKALRATAVNDVVAHRSGGARILELSTTVDGRHIATHRGDGFIAATPTGSTAYAMSCGGPIVDPRLDATVLAPICPHKLDDRPLVIPGAAKFALAMPADTGITASVSCDGVDLGVLEYGQTLHVSRSSRRLKLIHPSDYNYFSVLREKLNWAKGPATQGAG